MVFLAKSKIRAITFYQCNVRQVTRAFCAPRAKLSAAYPVALLYIQYLTGETSSLADIGALANPICIVRNSFQENGRWIV